MLESIDVTCPYCGETFETEVDASVQQQEYVEDCYVCCRPIVFHIWWDDQGQLSVETRREDD